MRAKKKAILFKILAFVFLLLPLTTLIVIKRDTYFAIKGESIKLSLGLIIALIFALMCLLGKVKKLNGIIILAILEVICFLLQSLMNDILIIIPCAIVGEMFYMIFNSFYKKYWEIYKLSRNASIDEAVRQEVRNRTETRTKKERVKIDGRA